MQHMSEYGLALLKQHEGLRLNAYQDIGGVWTIGFGHTLGVKEGDRISANDARNFFIDDLSAAERCVRARVAMKLTQGQFDALVSLVFNIGCGAFSGSTLLRHLNAGDYEKAAAEFPRWNRVKGQPVNGLTRRRAAEQRLFNRKGEA